MKKITFTLNWFHYLILGLLLSPSVYNAQQVENITTYKQESTTILAPILSSDAHLFKNSILYDRVTPLAGLRDISHTNETNSTHFKRAWKELYDARQNTTPRHIPIEMFNKVATHYQNQGTIPVGFLNIDFTQFTNTVLEDLETDRTTIAQLASRNRANAPSPYVNKHLFLASPIIENSIETLPNQPVQFELGVLGVNQAALNIKTLTVSYNNTVKTIVQNGVLTNGNFAFSFNSSGTKTLKFTATLINNQQLVSNAKIPINIIYVAYKSNTTTIDATEPFQGYDEPTDCNGNCFGKGEYKVFLGQNHTKLVKPLIILDGFDPGDVRKISDGDGSIISLIDNNDTEENMDKFRAEGFDVVILNFPKYEIADESFTFWHPFANQNITVTNKIYRDGGADYIERNANVLKALINKLNGEIATNGSTEKLKIIGPSMGA